MSRLPALAALLSLAFLLAACGGGGGGDTTTETSAAPTTTEATSSQAAGECTTVKAPPAAARSEPKPKEKLDPAKTYEVTFETNCGSFTVKLDQKQSPNATASIVSLVKAGYFDNTVFHRIVPGFVIQGGDPTATGTGGPGYSTVDTPPADARYTHGVVAMAKSSSE